ncbi:MAG: hypothetical protein QXU97_03075 [Fervidicoccaceae archaeon]
MAEVRGDLVRLVDSVIEEALARARKEIEEVYSASSKILDEARSALESKIERGLLESYSRALESLKSAEASAESSIRMKLSEVKSKWINEALGVIRSEVLSWRGERLKKILEKLLEDLISKAPEGLSIKLLAPPSSAEALRSLLERGGAADSARERKLRLVVEIDEKISSGFRAVSEDGKISFDYTLERSLEHLRPALEAMLSEELFGER